jgi:glycerol-3-phosphate acyltransferase PlsY
VVCCVAFLLGSFPSGVVLGRLTTGRDVRRFGSGNIGAANVARFAGFKVGAGVAVIDILKGVVPVLIGQWIGLGPAALTAAAAAAVLGHDFSVFLQFRGGKGVATTLGVMLVLAPLATVLAMVCWLIVLGVRGYSSLASLVALALLPIFAGFTGQEPVYVVLASVLFLLSAGKHWENIVRLIRGTEPVIRWPKRANGG